MRFMKNLRSPLVWRSVLLALMGFTVGARAAAANVVLPGGQSSSSFTIVPLDLRLAQPQPEPPGPSSRSTAIVISEIMYHPTNRVDGKNLEFIELYNSNPWVEDLGGYQLTGAINYTFPSNTTMPALSYRVVAASPADVQSVYGFSGALGPWAGTNGLPNGTGLIRLRNRVGAILLEVDYRDEPPWPTGADGAGHSLALARPSLGEADPRAWSVSQWAGGSPGTNEVWTSLPGGLDAVQINEFFAYSDLPDLDSIELFNYSAQAVDLAGCILTDDAETNKYVFPPDAVIPALGFLALDEAQLGFGLSSGGETIYFKAPGARRVVDAVRFFGQERGVSMGRSPDGASGFSPLAARTPGAANARRRLPDVVINELMYHPVSGDRNDEFVELYNGSTNAVNVGGWRLDGGVTFSIPANTTLPAGGYLVIAENATRLLTNYPGLAHTHTLGNYGGNLAHSGERIALLKPELTTATNGAGRLVTHTFYTVVNEVTYGTDGRWGQWSDGGGSSLELIDPRSDNQRAPSWADSDETAKSGWVTIEATGLLDHGTDAADSLHVFLQGPGECLVDNVEVIPAGGANRVANSTFESGTAGWIFHGSHERSSGETNGGFNSSRSLHIRASTRGDTGANKIRTPLTSALSPGQTVTLRAKVKWLRGHPEILLRLHGNYLEATGNIVAARNLGTPGARNSRALTNAPPAITEVTHAPVLPAANQPVTIVARVQDPDGVSAVWLNYRLDPASTFTRVALGDNGAGFYSGTLPGRAAGTLAAFYLEAVDGPGASARFPDNAPARECLVRWGETVPAGNFGTYRIWMTQARINRWIARERLSNEPLDATFAYGGSRVIYNAGAQYSGSPVHASGYTSPIGSNPTDYLLTFSKDDALLGEQDFTLGWAGTGGCEEDSSRQAQQICYWMNEQLGLPYNHHRYVNVFFNGLRRGTIFEDMQQPNGRNFAHSFPETPDGQVFKISIWFEFPDDLSTFGTLTFASLENFTTFGNAKKTARYRWNWQPRASDSLNDFTPVFGLVDAASNPASGEAYGAPLEALIDTEHWMRTFAMQHAIGNLDIFGSVNGQNTYAFKPDNDRWKLMVWDLDLAFGGCGEVPWTDLFRVNDPNIARMYNHPPFRRAFLRALLDIVNGPFQNARMRPVLDARYAALQASGINVGTTTDIKFYVDQRRSHIVQQLAGVRPAFALSGSTEFNTTNQLLTLSGTAPVELSALWLNGVAWPVTWTTVTNWQLRVALAAGTNKLQLQGVDLSGRPVTNAMRTVLANYTGPTAVPEGSIVFNEIMYNPAVPEASFVELFNTSSDYAFDLSGWRINGLGFTFPTGTLLTSRQFLVVTKNRVAFTQAYGVSAAVAGEFSGQLDDGGETLTLLRPGATAGSELVVDRIRYDDDAPWPTEADGTGVSVQLRDAAQDNSRVSNWAVPSGGWRFGSVTGVASSSRLIFYLNIPGEVYLDDISLVAGNRPGEGINLVRNSDFESAFRTKQGGPWIVSANLSNSVISTSVSHSGQSSLLILATSAGGGTATAIYQDTLPVLTNTVHTLSFWYLPSTNADKLTLRLTPGNSMNTTVTVRPTPATPGAPNSVTALLPPYPAVWLNELQTLNTAGLSDRQGEHEPWVELFNPGSASVSLEGFFLSDHYTNLTRWAFPSGATLDPGEFRVVFLDGEAGESTAAEWHANFRADRPTGSLALSRLVDGAPQILDYFNFENLATHRSYGSCPDGQPFNRPDLFFATPGAVNNCAAEPIVVRINEWMAANSSASGFADPADGNYDDWFELYNPSSAPSDLAGYYLTDNLTNRFQFKIPPGYVIPPGGFLLVWADNQSSQNNSNRIDLHVNFSLRQAGEAIGLFAADGTAMDTLVFGSQTNNVSEGRFPDGTGARVFMLLATPRLPNRSSEPPVAPRVFGVTLDNDGKFSFSAAVTPGHTYRLEYTDDLSTPNWTPLGQPQVAGTALITVTEIVGLRPRGFYRIVVLN